LAEAYIESGLPETGVPLYKEGWDMHSRQENRATQS